VVSPKTIQYFLNIRKASSQGKCFFFAMRLFFSLNIFLNPIININSKHHFEPLGNHTFFSSEQNKNSVEQNKNSVKQNKNSSEKKNDKSEVIGGESSGSPKNGSIIL